MRSNAAEIALALLIFAIGLFVVAIILWVCLAPPSRRRTKIIRKERRIIVAGEPGPQGQPGVQGPAGGTGGGASPPLINSFLVENTVFVDQKYGNDATGQREDPSRPFQTLNGALNTAVRGAQAGDTIWVRPDTYVVPRNQLILKDGVNWYFSEGVTLQTDINSLGFMFLDNGFAVNVEMTGYADIVVSSLTDNTTHGFLSIVNPNTNMLLELNSLSVTVSGAPISSFGIFVFAGTLRANIRNNMSVTGALAIGLQNLTGFIELSSKTVSVVNGGVFSVLFSAGHTIVAGQQLVANNNTTVFQVYRPPLANSPNLCAVQFAEVQMIGATGSFLVDVQDTGFGASNPSIVLDIQQLSILSSPANVIINMPLPADCLYCGNSIVISGGVVADEFLVVRAGARLFLQVQSVSLDTGTFLVQNNGAGLASFAALRLQQLTQTLSSATNVLQIVGGATQAITVLNIDQLITATNNVALLFTDALVNLTMQRLLLSSVNNAAVAIRTTTASNSTNVTGRIDRFELVGGIAIDNIDTSTLSTFDLQFITFLLGSNTVTTPVVMAGAGSMTLNGNVFNVQTAIGGANVTTGNFELKVIDLLNTPGTANTLGLITTNSPGVTTVDFDSCNCTLVGTGGALQLLRGSCAVRGNTLNVVSTTAVNRGVLITAGVGGATTANVHITSITVLGGSAGVEISTASGSNGPTVELQVGQILMDGTGIGLSIGVGTNTITGYVDVIRTVSGSAIFDNGGDASVGSTVNLRFDLLRSAQSGQGVITKFGISNMVLRGNTLDIASSFCGILMTRSNTLELDVVNITNDVSGVTSNIAVLSNTNVVSVSPARLQMTFQRCYVYIAPKANAAGWRGFTNNATISLHGHDVKLLNGPGTPLIWTLESCNLLARFGSVQCPSQALLVENDNQPNFPCRIDYHSEHTLSTFVAGSGSPPVAASPLFDIRPTGLTSPASVIDVFLAGGYNNALAAPVIMFTGAVGELPKTRVYNSILVGSPSMSGPVGYTVIMAPSSANTAPVGVGFVPAGSLLDDPGVE